MAVLAWRHRSAPVNVLEDAIEAAWERSTSSDPEKWSAENPAWGQCAVTALVVQDHLGGRLQRGVVGGISHYWNVLEDGREVDLTLHQFGYSVRPVDVDSRDRDYVLSFPATRTRYEHLREAVDRILAGSP